MDIQLDRHGFVLGFDDNSPLATCEKYDPDANSWSLIPNMSCPRGGVGVAALGGKIYAVGGHDGEFFVITLSDKN